MAWSESDLRAQYQAGMDPEPGTDCPQPERMWDAVGGALGRNEREQLILHMSGCPHCALVWQAARDLQPDTAVQTRRRPIPDSQGWWQFLLRPPVLAPLAGAAAALLIGVLWLQPGALPELPAPAASGVVRGLPDTPAPALDGNRILGPGQQLLWTPLGNASAHKLVLFSDDGQQVELLPSEPDQYRIEPEMAETFASGEQVYWYVEAIDGERPGARSATASFQFQVEPAGG